MSLSVDIRKSFGSFKLYAKFDAEEEILALLGPSGCGKSVTLKCIAGILKPDSGRIVLNGKVLFDSEANINIPPQKRNVGYLFQQYALFPNMTVEQNISVGIKPDSSISTCELIKTFRLEGLEKHKPLQLSGGQQQRTALARIMASEPELLLLDEPFSALDVELKYHLELEFQQVIRSFGKSVILVSHDRGEAYRLSDRIAIMRGGIVEPVCSKEEWVNKSGSVVIETKAVPQSVIIISV